MWKQKCIEKQIVKWKENILIYEEILELIKDYFEVFTDIVSIWSLDVFLTFQKNFIGFTGTPLIHPILIKKNENNIQNIKENNIIDNNIINNNINYEKINSIYNIKYTLLKFDEKDTKNDEDLYKFLTFNDSNYKIKYDCLIDVCGQFKKYDWKWIARYL